MNTELRDSIGNLLLDTGRAHHKGNPGTVYLYIFILKMRAR